MVGGALREFRVQTRSVCYPGLPRPPPPNRQAAEGASLLHLGVRKGQYSRCGSFRLWVCVPGNGKNRVLLTKAPRRAGEVWGCPLREEEMTPRFQTCSEFQIIPPPCLSDSLFCGFCEHENSDKWYPDPPPTAPRWCDLPPARHQAFPAPGSQGSSASCLDHTGINGHHAWAWKDNWAVSPRAVNWGKKCLFCFAGSNLAMLRRTW